jgi:hypothetical protein
MIEDIPQSAENFLETRAIYQRNHERIPGQAICCCLVFVLLKEHEAGLSCEKNDISGRLFGGT